jgi:hypothetical protein
LGQVAGENYPVHTVAAVAIDYRATAVVAGEVGDEALAGISMIDIVGCRFGSG